MIRIATDWRDYEGRPGTFANQRTISEYSVRADHSVINDRSNARYLIEDNIRDGLNVDLKHGVHSRDTFVDDGMHWRGVPSLQTLIRWAVNQNKGTIKEVFGDADFAGCQRLLRRVACTLIHPKADWTLSAQDFGGVILLSEGHVKHWSYSGWRYIETYCPLKFRQYMTTNSPSGRPCSYAPIDNRPSFETVVRSDLQVEGQTLKLCSSGEIDALCGDEPIEIKTVRQPTLNFRYNVQCELKGVKRVVFGMKKDEHILYKVEETTLEDIMNIGDLRERASNYYSFFFTVLSEIKKFLTYNDACRVSYDKYQKVVEIKSISREQARVDFGKEKGENGEFITDKLMTHFNL